MADPVLHLLAGPNGSGKSTLYYEVIRPATGLGFVNPDEIARLHWPDGPEQNSYAAARVAEATRDTLIANRASFVTETVFSHESKVDLVREAVGAGYVVLLHVVVIPENLAVARVTSRVAYGGHGAPEHKIRERYQRLWPLVVAAIPLAAQTNIYDNTSDTRPFREIAIYRGGRPLHSPEWPVWTPEALRTGD
jgi:predicted ABC-type ATPase